MYSVLRHGARFATAKRATETAKLKAVLLNRLGAKFSKNLENSKSSFAHRHPSSGSHGDLSELGMKEQYCLANRLKAEYPSLLGEIYSKDYYEFRSSQTSRSFKRFDGMHVVSTDQQD